jgi:hypothetical protein
LSDDVQVSVGAEVLHQEEACIDILRQHLRHAHAAAFEQLANAQPGTNVFLVRGRIHHDVRRRDAGGAPVAAEARIHRRAHEADFGITRGLAGPGQACFRTGIHDFFGGLVHGAEG